MNVYNIGTSTATISWLTDEDSDSVVEYGTSTLNYILSVAGTTIASGTDYIHSVSLTGLSASTTYYFIVKSTDAMGNSSQSEEHNFNTLQLTLTYLGQWGSNGSGDGQFSPRALSVDSQGNVYVVDDTNNRIQKFNGEGEYLDKWGTYRYTFSPGTFGGPCGIETDAFDFNYIADCGDARSQVQKFNNEGYFQLYWGERGMEEGQFVGMQYDLAVDSENNVYVLDASGRNMGNYGVHVFSSDGAFINRWGPFGSAPLREPYEDYELRNPYAIAIDTHDNVYIADQSRQIKKFTKDGTFISKWGIDELGWYLFRNPIGIATDDNDNVYVADYKSNEVQIFTSDGEFIEKFGSFGSGNGEFYYPMDVAIFADKIYVADWLNYRIQIFGYR